MKRFITGIVSLILFFSLTACGTGAFSNDIKGSGIVTSGKKLPDTADAVTLDPQQFSPYSYEKVASDGNFIMFYDKANSALKITTADESAVWNTVIDFESLGLKLSNVWKQNVSSMFEINYSNPNSNGRERIVTAALRKLKTNVWAKTVSRGMDIQYYFPERELGFTAEFRLTADGFSVNIPAESIIENGKCRFVSINMLPYFSATDAEDNGYILTPYSGGAVLDFGKDTQGKYIQLPVYSENNPEPTESTKLDSSATDSKYSESNVSSLPVVGMKNEAGGFLAFADGFGEDSYINISTAYYGIRFNRVSFSHYIRNVTTLNFSGTEDGSSGTADILDNDIIPTDKKINYDLFSGSCDYSLMAQKYREYLISKNMLTEKAKAADISLEILMGVPRQDVTGNTLVSVTTFAQALDMVKGLEKRGIKNAVINLKGWNKGGYGSNPTVAQTDGKLGGAGDMRELADYCKKTGYTLIMDANLTELNTDYSSTAPKKAAVVDNNGLYITNSDENIYYQRISAVNSGAEKLLKSFGKTAIGGISYAGFGTLMYRDYNKKVTYSGDFISGIKKILKNTAEKYNTVAVGGTNLYAMAESDIAYETAIPFTHSVVYSYFVPFMPMVTGGCVTLVSNPVNSFYSPTVQKLTQLEYGVIPNFELTNDSVYTLQNTHYNTLFSAKFDLWADSIEEEYGFRYKDLSEIGNSRMVKHTVLAKDIVCAEYENGKKLIINKTGSDYSYNGENIPAYRCSVTD